MSRGIGAETTSIYSHNFKRERCRWFLIDHQHRDTRYESGAQPVRTGLYSTPPINHLSEGPWYEAARGAYVGGGGVRRGGGQRRPGGGGGGGVGLQAAAPSPTRKDPARRATASPLSQGVQTGQQALRILHIHGVEVRRKRSWASPGEPPGVPLSVSPSAVDPRARPIFNRGTPPSAGSRRGAASGRGPPPPWSMWPSHSPLSPQRSSARIMQEQFGGRAL